MRHIPSWFAPPYWENAYKRYAAKVLHYVLLLFIALSAVSIITAPTRDQRLFAPLVLGLFIACYGLLQAKQLEVACILFLSGLWLFITIAAFNTNGVLNAALSSYVVIIILGAIFFNARVVIAITLASVAAVIGLIAGQMLGWMPLRQVQPEPTNYLLQYTGLFSTTGILLYATSRVVRRSVRQAEAKSVALQQEVEERERIEAAMRNSEIRYRQLFENISTIAGVWDVYGRLVLLNGPAEDFLDSTIQQLQGKHFTDIFPSEFSAAALEQHQLVVQQKRANVIESEVELPGGGIFPFLCQMMPLLDNNSDVIQVLCIVTDMSHQRAAERSREQLRLAQTKNEFFREFFGTLSHDFKTPLSIMRTSLYLIQQEQTTLQQHDKIQQLESQVELMDQLISDMLTISRLEHLPGHNFEAVQLDGLSREVVERLRFNLERKQIELATDHQPQLPAVRGDREQLQRMLINLVENAINYTSTGGNITIRTYTDKKQVVIAVLDDGIGIEPEALTRIFEQFYRTDIARETFDKGTGLGLAIVKKIVEIHDATVEVTSSVEEGTCFYVHFPVLGAPTDAESLENER